MKQNPVLLRATCTVLLLLCDGGHVQGDPNDCSCIIEQCECSSSGYVDCNNRNLTDIPEFTSCPNYIIYRDSLTVDLENNDISDLERNAFSSWNYVATVELRLKGITIQLQNNYISDINLEAFNGVEHLVTGLNLINNSLSEVPSVIGNLPRLETLLIGSNPIQRINEPVFISIGHSLKTLNVDADSTGDALWFGVLNHLVNLNTLQIVNVNDIHSNAFLNSRNLKRLDVYNSNFRTIPSSLCQLQTLEKLYLINNRVLGLPNGRFQWPTCENKLLNLSSLFISWSNITTFPDLSLIGPNITTMTLSHSQLTSFRQSDISVSIYTAVINLELSYNNLNSIPEGIKTFSNLQILNLKGNKITSIAHDTFVDMISLQKLNLENNRINAIEDGAFTGLNSLRTLRLGENYLTILPCGVLSLHALLWLDVTGDQIKCSCTQRWISEWITRGVSVSGTCGINQTDLLLFLSNCGSTVTPTCDLNDYTTTKPSTLPQEQTSRNAIKPTTGSIAVTSPDQIGAAPYVRLSELSVFILFVNLVVNYNPI